MNESILRDAKCLYDFMSSCPPSDNEPADMILALGSPDLRVPEHDDARYLQGAAPLIVCTGGFGKMTEGLFSQPEGAVFAERCAKKGVPKEAILIEGKATNTGENFSLSRQLTQSLNLTTAIAVCKPYMARRALATGKKQWTEIRWRVSVPPIPFEAYAPDEAALLDEIELMTGDLQRLKVYAEKGFQAETLIPPAVWQAWQRLTEAGFTRYLIV